MIAITAAFKSELNFLIQSLSNPKTTKISGRIFQTGNIGNKQVVIVSCGIGKIKTASATQLLISSYDLEAIIHIGVAGAISSKANIGDLILATEVIEHDYMQKFPTGKAAPKYKTSTELNKKLLLFDQKKKNLIPSTIISGTEDINTGLRKTELFEKHEAISVDWESAAAVQTANINNIPNSVIRAIVDSANENTFLDFKENLKTVSTKLNKYIIEFLKQIKST